MDTPQQQPTYPQTHIEVQPQGVLVIVTLAPGTQLTQLIPEEIMNQIAGKWLETRKQIKRELAIVQDIQRSKIN
jgi:hypothetical protein